MQIVDIENVKVKSAYCIPENQHFDQLNYSVKRIKGRIEPNIVDGKESVAVVCYGPSLLNEWEKIKNFKYIITCSGAHKFLIDRGIIPTWHVEVDPRPHKYEMMGKPHKDVEYLLASSVHKNMLDHLDGYNVKLWHSYNKDDFENIPSMYPRGDWIFVGGSTAGSRSLVISRFLGFSKIDVFGMDYSFPPNFSQHAGYHSNPAKQTFLTNYDGYEYATTPGMVLYAKEFFDQFHLLSDVDITVHGVGLLQAMIKNDYGKLNQREKKDNSLIAVQCPILISDDYLKLNEKLHETNVSYGTSGRRYVDEVKKICSILNTTDVLDYGCGKGTLASSLDFEIKEYDPAIESKKSTPKAADFVVCTDVLEHIEPSLLENVLGDIRRCMKKFGFFVISSRPAIKFLEDGRNAHLIQENKAWWWKELDKFFTIEEMIEKNHEIYAWVKPKNVSVSNEKENTCFSEFKYLEVDAVKFVITNPETKWRAQTLKQKEPITIEWIQTFKENEIFVDIGANVGGYSLYAAKNKKVFVYAFEPESQNYSTLNQNIFINELSNDVKAFPLALSDKIGIGDLNLTEFKPGSSCHQFDTMQNFKGEKLNSLYSQGSFSLTLDYLVENNFIKQPDHVKIDVDGIEPKVVSGALKTLSKCKSVLIEVNPNLSEHRKMVSLMALIGFKYNADQVERSSRKEGPFKGVAEHLFFKS
jgi:FkbM family methyltransferase